MNGKKTVYSNIVKTLKAHYPTLEEPIDLGNFIENEKINILLDNIKNNYISHWKQQITNSNKTIILLEQYLTTIKNPSQSFTKFRISNHKLLIEYGRYQKIPRDKRHCKDIGAVEDEFHFAFECPSYSSIRNNANNILKNIFQINITTDSKQNLLSYFLALFQNVSALEMDSLNLGILLNYYNIYIILSILHIIYF
jgi:hypothetical protein